jgi:hypothetical protein
LIICRRIHRRNCYIACPVVNAERSTTGVKLLHCFSPLFGRGWPACNAMRQPAELCAQHCWRAQHCGQGEGTM